MIFSVPAHLDTLVIGVNQRDECASHPCMNSATCHVSLQ